MRKSGRFHSSMDLCEHLLSIVTNVGDLICFLIDEIFITLEISLSKRWHQQISWQPCLFQIIYKFSTPYVPRHKVPWIIFLHYAFEMTKLIKKYVLWINFTKVVGSQTTNLTLGFSFGHNLCFRCSNGSCKPILDIYVSISLQSHKKIFKPMGFDPCNRPQKIWKSIGTPTPKLGVHLGVWGNETLCTFQSMKCDSWASLLACNLASPCLGHEPKVRVTTPSITIAFLISSNCLMESSVATFYIILRSSQLILPLSYSSYACCNFIGLRKYPTSYVEIGIFVGKKELMFYRMI
jgi:hypothetical protein